MISIGAIVVLIELYEPNEPDILCGCCECECEM